MPCDTIQRSKTAFLADVTDVTILARGLAKKGYQVRQTATGLAIYRNGQQGTFDARTGRLDIPRGWEVDEFKRAYARETVVTTAEEHGWELQWSTNPNGEEEATVTRRI